MLLNRQLVKYENNLCNFHFLLQQSGTVQLISSESLKELPKMSHLFLHLFN